MIAQQDTLIKIDDRKKTEEMDLGHSPDYTWSILIGGYIFLGLAYRWVYPLIDSVWLMLDKWRLFLHYH